MSGTVKAEWLPAHLAYNGPAKVAEYFDSRVLDGPNGRFIGFFRGHEMVGKVLEIPPGYHACVVSTEGHKLEVLDEVDPVRVWDLDAPSLDVAMQFTDAIEIGRILAED
jgi:hypothetical protein